MIIYSTRSFPTLHTFLSRLSVGLCFLFVLSATPSLKAQTFTAEAQGFNVFVQQSFTFGGGDVEGAVAAGGDLTLQGNQGQFSIQEASAYVAPGMSAGLGLLIGDQVNLSGGGLNMLSGAKVIIGNSTGLQALSTDQNGANVNTRIVSSSGSYSSTPNISLDHQQSETVFQSSPINFTDAFNTLQTRSGNVSALATNMTITNANGDVQNPTSISNNSQIYIQTLGSGANILNLTGANLNKISSITFNTKPSASKYLIINIDKPGTFNWDNFNFTGVSSTDAQYILLNFHNSTTVNINSSSTVFATVYAPFAAVAKNNSANIDGQVIAQSFTMTQGGEVHKMYFLSDDPSAAPFPVEWAGFAAEWEGAVARLRWTTATEVNSSHFDIERSTDSRVFEQIGELASVGYSDQLNSYSFGDASAATLSGQKIYYRLKQWDMDGQVSYSSTIELDLNGAPSLSLSAFPNPSEGQLTVQWSGMDSGSILTVTDIYGRQLGEVRLMQESGEYSLNLTALPTGMYHLTLADPFSSISTRIILK